MSPSKSIRGSEARWVAVACLFVAVAAASLYALVIPAQAHGFGQRYDLPLPLSLYITGACVAIVVTFLIVGLFVRDAPRAQDYPRLDLSAYRAGRLVALPGLAFALKFCGLAIFIVTIIAGFRGQEDPYRNIAPTMVWIIWWVGLAYVCAFVGNLWALINPWSTISGIDRNHILWPRQPARALARSALSGKARHMACVRPAACLLMD